MDEDGYIHFIGRNDDVITSAGYRIGPGEIEDCILRHPSVKMVAVVGVPDAQRTEIVAAVIVLHDGHSPSDDLKHEIQENRSEENTSELQSLMRTSYAVYCL